MLADSSPGMDPRGSAGPSSVSQELHEDSRHSALEDRGQRGQVNGWNAQSAPNTSQPPLATRLPNRKKEALSQVPCKFFRASGCSAGDACPFAHILPGEGQGRTVCQWFLKGNCRFGHRCAHAHILPGQPMSMDRKNKRAQQQQGQGFNARAGPGNGMQQFQPPPQMPTQHARFDASLFPPNFQGNAFAPSDPFAGRSVMPSHPMRESDFVFGMPDDLQAFGNGMPAPPLRADPASIDQQHDWSRPPLGLEQPHARDGFSRSPARIGVFGTSPFNRPGSQSVFFSGDSADASGESKSLGKSFEGKLSTQDGVAAINIITSSIDDAGPDEVDDVEGESFLPSSLSDLLTPEELRRRQMGGLGAELGRQRQSSAALAQSVPAQGLRPEASAAMLNAAVNSPRKPSNLSTSFTASSPPENAINSGLSASPHDETSFGDRAFRLGASNSSTGFMASRINGQSQGGSMIWAQDSAPLTERPSNAYSPGMQAALDHAPGESLPRGLASGLSRLHLRSADTSMSTTQDGAKARQGLEDSAASGDRPAPLRATGEDELAPIAPSSLLNSGGIGAIGTTLSSRLARGEAAKAVGSPLARPVTAQSKDKDGEGNSVGEVEEAIFELE